MEEHLRVFHTYVTYNMLRCVLVHKAVYVVIVPECMIPGMNINIPGASLRGRHTLPATLAQRGKIV